MNWIEPPGGKPWALLGLCGASAVINIVLVGALMADGPSAPTIEPCLSATAPVAVQDAITKQGTAPVGAVVTIGQPQPAHVAPVPAPSDAAPAHAAPVALTADGNVVRGTLTHSLVRTFHNEAGEHADVLNAVYSRLFFWDLDLRRDLQKGDEVEASYRWDGKLAHIDVARYKSNKLGQTLTAYLFHASGDTFPTYWTLEGEEVSRRLKNSPIREYQQVTALIKDRPSHKGMDFKTPVGTEIVSPKSATVVRTNWNTRFNGNSVELKFNDGTLARFLHLSETGVKAGQTVQAGQRIGASGNTGRSTAPHLHYELEKAGRVLDPVDYHGTTRRTLPVGDRNKFERKRIQLDGVLQSPS
jgi:murein DD-endopeptidase MepM/ murein hydrolase activator NlpD